MKPATVPPLLLLCLLMCLQACAQDPNTRDTDSTEKKCLAYYEENKGNSKPSRSIGSTGKGRLENGKLMPYKGKNFRYFDAASYLAGRAYLHGKVRNTLLGFYRLLDSLVPGKMFYVMECSGKNGGYFFPHNTHQNGLSVDLMMPMLRDGKSTQELDTMGISHYWLSFDSNGKYSGDSAVSIDFELLARQILVLEKAARVNGMRIVKVIIMTELREELFSGTYGHQLKKSGIYFAQMLPARINTSHDEHIHVDFAALN